MARDSIFRIASITKPITAAAVMMLIDDGRLSLDDAVARWLPALTSPTVVRPPGPLTHPSATRRAEPGRAVTVVWHPSGQSGRQRRCTSTVEV